MINVLYFLSILTGILALVAVARVRVYVMKSSRTGHGTPAAYRAARTAIVSGSVSLSAGTLVLASTGTLSF